MGGRSTSPGMTENEGPPSGGPPPRSYSEFMRSLAAKYNGENPADTARAAEQAKPALLLAQGAPAFPFPPFLFPPSSLAEGMKEGGGFPFLGGLRPPLHPGLLESAQAQALLTMMRAQAPPGARLPPPTIPLPAHQPPPAKKARRSSSSIEEPPVSPPSSRPPPRDAACPSTCASTAACSEQGRAVLAWDTKQVAEFVRSLPPCAEYAELFVAESIDGAVLALLTDTHLQALGMKLGPALRLRAALAGRLGTCPACRHCRHCHQQQEDSPVVSTS